MAVEQVIRSLQNRSRDGDEAPRQAMRKEILGEMAQSIRRRLVEATELDPHLPEALDKARHLVQRFLDEEEGRHRLLVLTSTERAELEERILAGIFGFGILTPFVHDESITEVMVNGLDRIFIERKGDPFE